MAKATREQLQHTNVREQGHEQIAGQMSLADEVALEAWVADTAARFVFAPALVVDVVEHARVVNINSRRRP